MIVVAEVCRRKGRRARIVPNETLRGIMICGFAWSRRAIKLIPWCWDQDVHPVRQPGIHCRSKAWQSFLCALARGSIPPNTSCQGRGQTHYEEQWSFPHEKKRFSCSDSCCYLFKSIQQYCRRTLQTDDKVPTNPMNNDDPHKLLARSMNHSIADHSHQIADRSLSISSQSLALAKRGLRI